MAGVVGDGDLDDRASRYMRELPAYKCRLGELDRGGADAEILVRLTPGRLASFCLPVDIETYTRYAGAPDELFKIWLEADGQRCKAVFLSAYERQFEGEIDYSVVTW